MAACAYTANLTLFKVQRIGLLNWIDSANAARRAAGAQRQDMVLLLVHETAPSFGADGSVNQPYRNCPENVDALVLRDAVRERGAPVRSSGSYWVR